MFNWESQNKNTPKTPHMKMIIDGKQVVLFVRIHEKRKSKSQPFTYAGQLEYVHHNHPVEIESTPIGVVFKLMEYKDPASNELSALYEWHPGNIFKEKPIDTSKIVLKQVSAPTGSIKDSGRSNATKIKRKIKIDWAKRDELNRNLGLAGEKLIFEREIKRLTDLGLNELAQRVEHVAITSDGDGYDILSFDKSGVEKYIEVKTTKQPKGTPFFISRNELDVSKEKNDQYWIYRIYGLKDSSIEVNFYALPGPVDKHFELISESYKASPKRTVEGI